MGYRLGVDVGGTFTDLLLFNADTGAFWRHKTPSTPHDSSEGILNGVTAICAQRGDGLSYAVICNRRGIGSADWNGDLRKVIDAALK